MTDMELFLIIWVEIHESIQATPSNFLANFHHLVTNKKSSVTHTYKGFFWRKDSSKSPDFEECFSSEIAILTQ
jgi:hypothetical protein